MRLHTYFSHIQSQKLSEKDKNALYERILRQAQHQKPIFSRTRFYVKMAGYMTFLGVLGLSIYIPFLGQNKNSEEGIQTANVVNAGYIAKVVNVQGEYFIESNGARIEGSNINDGDRVILANGSSLIVQVGDKVEGKISGPATFIVNRSEKGYAITLKEGDYIEVATLGDKSNSPEIALISESHKFTARTEAGKGFHFILTEQNQKPLLVNKSSEDIQVTNENTPEKTIFLAENKSISVGTYIFATTVTPTEVAKVLARTTSSDEAKNIDEDYDNSFFRGMLLSSTAQTDDSMMAKTASDDRSAIQTYDTAAIRGNLIPQFVWVDIKYITYYYLNGQENEFHISYENLLKRLYNLYDALQIDIPSNGVMSSQKDAYSLGKLYTLANHIENNLPVQVTDVQEKTVHTMVLLIQKLSQQSFGAYKGQNLSLEQMFQKIQ